MKYPQPGDKLTITLEPEGEIVAEGYGQRIEYGDTSFNVTTIVLDLLLQAANKEIERLEGERERPG